MLVREITKHDRKVLSYTPTFYQPGANSRNEMSKLEYAMYVSNLPYKPGDLLVVKNAQAPYRYTDIYRLKSIDEIHRFVVFA